MSDIFNVAATSRISSDIKTVNTNSGMTIVEFSVAVNKWSKKDDKEIGKFYNIKAFGKTAENIGKYFKKGDRFIFSGSPDVDQWENKEGQKRSKVVFIVDNFIFNEKSKSSDSFSSKVEDIF